MQMNFGHLKGLVDATNEVRLILSMQEGRKNLWKVQLTKKS
jgi:hypothetical protein